MGLKLYGFFYCSCIYESGFSLETLHISKKSAYDAMMKHKRAKLESHAMLKDTHLHLGKEFWKLHRSLNPLESQLWTVRGIEVLP